MALNAGQAYGPPKQATRKTFVLCFDGTGNKFQNAPSDSNILKIFRMLDKNLGSHHYHYYQPGIGTYADISNLSHTSRITRFKSWAAKAKDSAIGASVDQHIVSGYEFLMKHYTIGDDIYMFGFSRGAYIARFLAEMLDCIGLLSTGNEEMVYFAWKTLLRWQTRSESTDEEKAAKDKLFDFMAGFRETFCRPVRRLRFLGLFDTVNSIPRFESALFSRSRFPYSCETSAKVIRHCVSIDERRVKFRQDLISDASKKNEGANRRQGMTGKWMTAASSKRKESIRPPAEKQVAIPQTNLPEAHEKLLGDHLANSRRFATKRAKSPRFRLPSRNRDTSQPTSRDRASAADFAPSAHDSDSDGEEQDIEEVWFPGCHADIGGGWAPRATERELLSHGPLVWMVENAIRAGVKFDIQRLRDFHVVDDQLSDWEWQERGRETQAKVVTGDMAGPSIPRISIEADPTDPTAGPSLPSLHESASVVSAAGKPEESKFRERLLDSSQTGVIHDCLDLGGGLGFTGTMAWKAFELIPFKRMDLTKDGSWRCIRFPLPLGEPRDAPYGAKVHVSAIRRMEADKTYRPGCIIVGGGGRGTKVAPAELGMGKWKVLQFEGDPVMEVFVRADLAEKQLELKRAQTANEEHEKAQENGKQTEAEKGARALRNQELETEGD